MWYGLAVSSLLSLFGVYAGASFMVKTLSPVTCHATNSRSHNNNGKKNNK